MVNSIIHPKFSYFTVLYDKDGTRYNQGSGLILYVDGKKVVHKAGIEKITFSPLDFEISDVNWENSQLSCSIISNNVDCEPTVIVALYDQFDSESLVLRDVKFQSVELKKGVKKDDVVVSGFLENAENPVIKVFLWDSMSNLKPLIESVTVE